MTERRHEHDCPACVFLGPHESYDMYWCPKTDFPSLSTVLGRYGCQAHEYESYHPAEATCDAEGWLREIAGSGRLGWYLEAMWRAAERGLYTGNLAGICACGAVVTGAAAKAAQGRRLCDRCIGEHNG